jgi:type I restriction enzyme S subunit
MKWEKVGFNDVLEKIVGGGTPSKTISDYWNGDIPWCSVKDMVGDKYQLYSTEDTITNSGIENSSSNLIPAGTVITSTRMGLGRAFINKVDMAINQDLKALLPNEKIDNKFLLWTIVNKKEEIEGLGIGSTVKGIRLEVLRGLKFNLPPLPTQRKIASILSAYDDLIENNLKRIKLLEEKAQMHYKELMQDSSKWDKVRLEEFVSVVKGRKPANVLEQPEEESQLYLLLDTVERGKTLYTSDLSLPQSKITDVLMCMDGARSGLSFRGMIGAIGSTMAIWRSNSERVSGEYLYQFMKQNESAITQGNTGAAIPHANRKFILDMKMAMPPKKEGTYFDGLTLPMIRLINTLHNQNAKLREARDILLPKLMSGQIEV